MGHKLIADVFDVLLIDPKNKNVVASTTLQDSNIEVTLESNDVRGGKGNELIATLHAGRDITINLTDVEFNYEWLAMQLGQNIKTAAGVAYAMPKKYTVKDDSSTLIITLDEVPILDEDDEPELLKIFDANGDEVTIADVTDNVVTLTGVQDGDEVEVRTYTYATDEATETITIDNRKFAGKFICILETLQISNDEQPEFKIQYQFDEVRPTGEFTIETTSERTGSTQAMTLRVMKPEGSSMVGRVLRIPIEPEEENGNGEE